MNEYLHPIEGASIDELMALQLSRLKETITHAYTNSTFWKNKFDNHGVSPADITQISDLAKFPFLVKEELRQNYPFGTFCVPQEQITRIHASSGTTGLPTVVGYTTSDIEDWADCIARSIFSAGGRPGDIIQVSYGYGLFTGGLGAHYGATKLGCTVVPLSTGRTETQVKLLKDFGSKIIMVTPSYLMTIADAMKKLKVDKDELKLKIGILGAEPWTLSLRNKIEEQLNISALDIYGLSEVMGPGVGQETIENKGKTTLWEDYFYPEIIDDEGNVLPAGEKGELVFTSLTKKAMPVIRYRTRDLTTLYPPTEGRSMRSMDRITGRNDDLMIIKGVNVFPSTVEEQIIAVKGLSPNYQIELTKIAHNDHITVHVESINDSYDKINLANELIGKIRNNIGIGCEVKVDVKKIPQSEGKAKRVIDNRNIDNRNNGG